MDEPPKVKWHEAIGAMTAACTALASAALYLDGSAYWKAFESDFGLSGAISHDLFSIIVQGETGTLNTMGWCVWILAFVFLIAETVFYAKSRISGDKDVRYRWLRALLYPFDIPLRALPIVYMLAVLLLPTVGSVDGHAAAQIAFKQARASVNLATFVVGGEQFTGLPLVSDRDRVALLLPSSEVILLRWDTITRVQRSQAGQRERTNLKATSSTGQGHGSA